MSDAIGEAMNAQETLAGTLVMNMPIEEFLNPKGIFTVEHIRDGEVIHTEQYKNVVTTEGKNAILDKFLGLGAAYATIVLGLHTTVGSSTSTYATPSPQVETSAYSNGTRPVPSFSAASAGSKATSSAVTFNINGTVTVTGSFCAVGASGITTKGDTATGSAVLLSTGAFGASRACLSGDTLNVSYSLAL